MKKIFDEEFKDFLASDVYSGVSGYELLDKEKSIYKKDGKLYTGEIHHWKDKGVTAYTLKIKMIPYGILYDLEKNEHGYRKEIFIKFPVY